MGRIHEILDRSFQNDLTHIIEQELQQKNGTNELEYGDFKSPIHKIAMPRVPGNVGSINLSALSNFCLYQLFFYLVLLLKFNLF